MRKSDILLNSKATNHIHSDIIKLKRVIMMEYIDFRSEDFGLGANDIYQRASGWDQVAEGLRKLEERTGMRVTIDKDGPFVRHSKITCINITLEP